MKLGRRSHATKGLCPQKESGREAASQRGLVNLSQPFLEDNGQCLSWGGGDEQLEATWVQ